MRALAGMSRGLYAFLSWIFKQASPATADETYGWRWAAIWDIYQKPSTPWEGILTFVGVDATLIPSGTIVTRADGYEYETTEDGTISSGSAEIPTTAGLDYEGVAGNNEDGSRLSLATPIPGVNAEVTTDSTTNGGEDLETWADGLVRLLARVRGQGDGGTAGFYENAALEVSGVTRAWESSIGGGEVSLRFVRDNDGTGSAILPDSGERAEVLAYVQSVSPITVTVSVATLTANTVAVTMTASPNTTAVKNAIVEELKDFFLRDAEPGLPLQLSRLDESISRAAGEVSHLLSTPVADVTSTENQMPILGTVTINGDVVFP